MQLSALAILLASAAFGQDRVFQLTYAKTAQDVQEIATILRSTGDIREVSADGDGKSLAVSGTPGQIDLAEWLVKELDRPQLRQQQPAVPEYRVSGDDIVRVFYLAPTLTLQDLQEVATVLRSTGDIRRLFVYREPRAIVMRGTAAQSGMAAWLVNELNGPPGALDVSSREYLMPGEADGVVRVFYVTEAETVQELRQIAIQVRTATRIMRLFIYNQPRALVLRGTRDQIMQAARLIDDAR